MKMKDATWLVLMAQQVQQAAGEVCFFCGSDAKAGRLIVAVGKDENPVELAEDYELVTDDAAIAIEWLCQETICSRLKRELAQVDLAVEEGDLTLAYRASDALAETVRSWVQPCEITLGDLQPCKVVFGDDDGTIDIDKVPEA